MNPKILTLFLGLALALPAAAERADRNNPVNIEADKVKVDDRNKVHTFEGNVLLTQGSLSIRSDKLVVTQDAEGFQKSVSTGGTNGLSHIRQKREGKNEYVDGEAERIEYDSRAEKSRLFNRAWIKSGGDEVRGQYIEYDGYSENYTVSNGSGGAAGAGAAGRVTATIQPKNSAPAPVAPEKGR